MPRVLNVAEKPSVAKEASKILGNNSARSRRGPAQYNPIWEFSYSIAGTGPCDMTFTSVAGHLMAMDFPVHLKKWSSCSPLDLYSAPITKSVPHDKSDLKIQLEQLARQAQWLVLWLDCDREGENISFEVIQVCQAANPRLVIRRARFSALTYQQLNHTINHLVTPNQNDSLAVDARQEIDLRIGASFTRFQTLLLQSKFDWQAAGMESQPLLSYGPCQFPTLGLIVQRAWEIQSHVSEPFWYIHVAYQEAHHSQQSSVQLLQDQGVGHEAASEGHNRHNSINQHGRHAASTTGCDFVWIRGRLFDRDVAQLLFEGCQQAPLASVLSVDGNRRTKWAPSPLSTLEMQKRGTQYLRLPGERIMKVAEELYQAGFISYPRTETDIFTPEMDLQAIVAEQVNDPRWGSHAQQLMLDSGGGSSMWRVPRGGGHDDKAHPPIHPTKYSSGENDWHPDKKRLYEFVVRSFLACCSLDAVGFETSVSVEIAGETFKAVGLMVVERNWLEVYPYTNWGGKELPVFQPGQSFWPSELALKEGATQPAPRLTERDLLSKMEQYGIGTDATIAEHIQKQLERGYAVKDEGSMTFWPTHLGEALIGGYRQMGLDGLWLPQLRGKIERAIADVAAGRATKDQVLESAIEYFKKDFIAAQSQSQVLVSEVSRFFHRLGNQQPTAMITAGGLQQLGGVSVGSGATLASPGLVLGPCRQCGMPVLIRRSGEGAFYIECDGAPACRMRLNFPRAVTSVDIIVRPDSSANQPSYCPTCTHGAMRLIDMRVRMTMLPAGLVHAPEVQGCALCSTQIKQIADCASAPAQQQRQQHLPSSSTNPYHPMRSSHHQPQRQDSDGRGADHNTLGAAAGGGARGGGRRGSRPRSISSTASGSEDGGGRAHHGRSRGRDEALTVGQPSLSTNSRDMCTRDLIASRLSTFGGRRGRGARGGRMNSEGRGATGRPAGLAAGTSRGRSAGSRGGGHRGGAGNNNMNTSNGNGGGTAGGGRFVGATGQSGHDVCFKCGQPGHWSREEKRCRFCDAELPDYKETLSQGLTKPQETLPLISVHFGGQAGVEGRIKFEGDVRRLLRLPSTQAFDVSFECKYPEPSGAPSTLQLKGIGSYEAAVFCAGIAAAKRKMNKSPELASVVLCDDQLGDQDHHHDMDVESIGHDDNGENGSAGRLGDSGGQRQVSRIINSSDEQDTAMEGDASEEALRQGMNFAPSQETGGMSKGLPSSCSPRVSSFLSTGGTALAAEVAEVAEDDTAASSTASRLELHNRTEPSFIAPGPQTKQLLRNVRLTPSSLIHNDEGLVDNSSSSSSRLRDATSPLLLSCPPHRPPAYSPSHADHHEQQMRRKPEANIMTQQLTTMQGAAPLPLADSKLSSLASTGCISTASRVSSPPSSTLVYADWPAMMLITPRSNIRSTATTGLWDTSEMVLNLLPPVPSSTPARSTYRQVSEGTTTAVTLMSSCFKGGSCHSRPSSVKASLSMQDEGSDMNNMRVLRASVSTNHDGDGSRSPPGAEKKIETHLSSILLQRPGYRGGSRCSSLVIQQQQQLTHDEGRGGHITPLVSSKGSGSRNLFSRRRMGSSGASLYLAGLTSSKNVDASDVVYSCDYASALFQPDAASYLSPTKMRTFRAVSLPAMVATRSMSSLSSLAGLTSVQASSPESSPLIINPLWLPGSATAVAMTLDHGNADVEEPCIIRRPTKQRHSPGGVQDGYDAPLSVAATGVAAAPAFPFDKGDRKVSLASEQDSVAVKRRRESNKPDAFSLEHPKHPSRQSSLKQKLSGKQGVQRVQPEGGLIVQISGSHQAEDLAVGSTMHGILYRNEQHCVEDSPPRRRRCRLDAQRGSQMRSWMETAGMCMVLGRGIGSILMALET
ncbi:hypothetical protein CEUSTIGMA_g12348.t1 [Chlamydomonas eustigma]|uniref:DNA topoisomerase n=1 Tax=Chlamydomonas eustigma TaxID=1157962 RepID=A0A250XPC7_9CHLO|nr:hypothetical protein CEUSTIGMA_g12348.t1 [Chlamydomonas eustigma]|eukprot:GAX84927.1 hypothetical protein CEUSTIGMA_g12348.t1 [Chlamydomonas eustigma]